MARRLLTLNGLAILCAVFYHATAWGYTSMFWWTDRYRNVSVPNFDQLGNGTYYSMRFVEQLVIFAIPTFIFVSGYFIAFATQRNAKTIEWVVILNRVRNLIIPFVLWSILILLMRWFEGIRHSPVEYLEIIALGRAADPYYYVPLLIQLYLIAPFLVPFARKNAKWLLIITGIVQFILLIARYSQILKISVPVLDSVAILDRSGFFLTYLFWFCFGMTVGFHLKEFKAMLDKVKKYLPGAMLVFFILGVIEWEYLIHLSGQEWIGPAETLIDQLYSGMLVLSFLAYGQLPASLTSPLADLGGKSYGIYLAHAPVMEFAARLTYHLLPGLLGFQIGFMPFLILLSLAVPLLLMAAVDRSPARFGYKYLFG